MARLCSGPDPSPGPSVHFLVTSSVCKNPAKRVCSEPHILPQQPITPAIWSSSSSPPPQAMSDTPPGPCEDTVGWVYQRATSSPAPLPPGNFPPIAQLPLGYNPAGPHMLGAEPGSTRRPLSSTARVLVKSPWLNLTSHPQWSCSQSGLSCTHARCYGGPRKAVTTENPVPCSRRGSQGVGNMELVHEGPRSPQMRKGTHVACWEMSLWQQSPTGPPPHRRSDFSSFL